MHGALDTNRDGSVDKKEFIEGMQKIVSGLSVQQLTDIFTSIDINDDKYLSLNEFSLFIKGAQLQRDERVQRLDPSLQEDVKRRIRDLFNEFDKDGDGKVIAAEIYTFMKVINPITMEKAQEMIKSVDANGNGAIDRDEFQQLMMPIVLNEMVSSDESIEQYRSLFLEADLDYSGYLSVDELYSVLLKTGVDITR